MKGEIRKKWGQLTDDDVEATKGNAQALVGLVQQKLGIAKEEALRHIHEITDRFERRASETKDAASDRAYGATNAAIDSAKDKLK